jgi:ribosomal protein L37AE/L43A
MRSDDFDVEDVVRAADAQGVNSFELAESAVTGLRASIASDERALTRTVPEECPECGDQSPRPLSGNRWRCACCGSVYCVLSQVELNAFADAVQDYVVAFESESDRETLAAEGRELLARMGCQA